MIDIKAALKSLCLVCAPAGFETAATDRAGELLRPLVDGVETDRLGNLCGSLSCGDADAPVVLLDAHLDEIGFMVTGVEENGFLRFCALGSVDARLLPAAEIFLMADKPVYGVVACLPPHLVLQGDREKTSPISELFIDTGGVPVPVGTVGTFYPTCADLGEGLFSSKSLDNRACFAAILRALELIPAVELLRGKKRSVNLVVCASVQEELGAKGIKTAAWNAKPSMGIVLDVTFGRTPDGPKDKTFELGSGVCIGWGAECSRSISKQMESLAKEMKIPYQNEIMPGRSGTNAGNMQISRRGVAAGVLSLPVRYMHSPVETMNLGDLESTARLLAEWVVSL